MPRTPGEAVYGEVAVGHIRDLAIAFLSSPDFKRFAAKAKSPRLLDES